MAKMEIEIEKRDELEQCNSKLYFRNKNEDESEIL